MRFAVAQKQTDDSLTLINQRGLSKICNPMTGAACGGIHVDGGDGYRVCQSIGERMKRSQVNDIMVQADDMIRSFGFTLPPFAYWSPETFKRNAAAARPIIEAQCG